MLAECDEILSRIEPMLDNLSKTDEIIEYAKAVDITTRKLVPLMRQIYTATKYSDNAIERGNIAQELDERLTRVEVIVGRLEGFWNVFKQRSVEYNIQSVDSQNIN